MAKKGSSAKAGVIGAVVGALAGVFLLAPKGAKQNRATVAKTANKARREAEVRLKGVYADLQTQMNKLKAKGAKLTGKAKKELDDTEGKVQVLLDKAKELITTLREGDDEVDAQVQKVIAEADKLKKTIVEKAKAGVSGTGRKASDK